MKAVRKNAVQYKSITHSALPGPLYEYSSCVSSSERSEVSVLTPMQQSLSDISTFCSALHALFMTRSIGSHTGPYSPHLCCTSTTRFRLLCITQSPAETSKSLTERPATVRGRAPGPFVEPPTPSLPH